MTKEQCLNCGNIELSDAGDNYVADVAATCLEQCNMPKSKNIHGVSIYLRKDNLIVQSVLEGKVCGKQRIRV